MLKQPLSIIILFIFLSNTAFAKAKVPTVNCKTTPDASGVYTQVTVTWPDLHFFRYLARVTQINADGSAQINSESLFTAEGSIDFPDVTPRMPEFREVYVKFYDQNERRTGGMGAEVSEDISVLKGNFTLFDHQVPVTCRFQ